MKYYKILFVILLVASIFFFGCEKSEGPQTSRPHTFRLSLDLKNTQNIPFEDGQVEISGFYTFDGEVLQAVGPSYWGLLGRDEVSSNENNNHLFGIECNGPNCGDSNYISISFADSFGGLDKLPSKNESWTRDIYRLIRFNGTDIDTLRIRDILSTPQQRNFTFYINGDQKETFYQGNPINYMDQNKSYITIQK